MFESIFRRAGTQDFAPARDPFPRVVVVLTVLAAALRLYELGSHPPGFFCDEAIIGVLADSLLRTGRDIEGRWFPFLFHGFGSWRPGFSVYAAIPWIKIFGVTEFATRLSGALYGIATVPALYELGRRLFGKNVGIFAAFLLAALPWHLHLSRIQFDTAMSVFFATLLLIAIDQLRNGEKHAAVWFWLSVAGFFFSYPSAPVQLVASLPFFALALRRRIPNILKNRRYQYTSLAVGTPFLLTVAWASWSGLLFGRLKQVWDPDYTVTMFLTGYAKHFSHAFLAALGEAPELGAQVLRHSVQGYGLLLSGAYALACLGALFALREAYRRDFGATLVVGLLLAAPIPAAMVSIVPRANRSAVLLLPVVLLIALAIERLRQRFPVALSPKLASFAVALWMLAGLTQFHAAWQKYALNGGAWMAWQYGYDSAARWAASHQDEYDRIYITHQFNGPNMLSLFYRAKWKCEKCEVMENPATVGRHPREFFFVREADIPQALARYPELEFVEAFQILEPNGELALRAGQFLKKSPKTKKRATASNAHR
jgi:4-amino-4-deoxy-L-arabinose transferase-like glycosyltransferase